MCGSGPSAHRPYRVRFFFRQATSLRLGRRRVPRSAAGRAAATGSRSLLSITLSVILGDASEVFDSRVAQDPLAKPSASCKRTGLRDVL